MRLRKNSATSPRWITLFLVLVRVVLVRGDALLVFSLGMLVTLHSVLCRPKPVVLQKKAILP